MPMSFALSDSAAEEPVESVGALSDSERLLLWGIRAWVGYRRQALPPGEEFERIFAERDARLAACWLNELLAMIAWAPTRPVDVRCHGCAALSPDEMRLLATVAALQREPRRIAAPLRALVSPALISIADEIAMRLARAMRDALFMLPLRRWPALGADPACEDATPAGVTLH